MEGLYFSLGILLVVVITLVVTVIIGMVRLNGLKNDSRAESEIFNRRFDNLYRDFANDTQDINRNIIDHVNDIHRTIDKRYDQLKNYVDNK